MFELFLVWKKVNEYTILIYLHTMTGLIRVSQSEQYSLLEPQAVKGGKV